MHNGYFKYPYYYFSSKKSFFYDFLIPLAGAHKLINLSPLFFLITTSRPFFSDKSFPPSLCKYLWLSKIPTPDDFSLQKGGSECVHSLHPHFDQWECVVRCSVWPLAHPGSQMRRRLRGELRCCDSSSFTWRNLAYCTFALKCGVRPEKWT